VCPGPPSHSGVLPTPNTAAVLARGSQFQQRGLLADREYLEARRWYVLVTVGCHCSPLLGDVGALGGAGSGIVQRATYAHIKAGGGPTSTTPPPSARLLNGHTAYASSA
jgi:hypothetical protein